MWLDVRKRETGKHVGVGDTSGKNGKIDMLREKSAAIFKKIFWRFCCNKRSREGVALGKRDGLKSANSCGEREGCSPATGNLLSYFFISIFDHLVLPRILILFRNSVETQQVDLEVDLEKKKD